MPYWQLFYHIVWATKERMPLLTPEVEPTIHGFLRGKASGLGATVFALNGTDEHVHMVVSIPPKLSIAKFIGNVKGVASARYNKSHPDSTPLFWQRGYGVFSFQKGQLRNFVAYVDRQKEHHRDNTVIPLLERTSESVEKVTRESTVVYGVTDSVWRQELEGLTQETS